MVMMAERNDNCSTGLAPLDEVAVDDGAWEEDDGLRRVALEDPLLVVEVDTESWG